MADKTPAEVAQEVSDIIVGRLSKQLRKFDEEACKAEIAEIEEYGRGVINAFMNDKKMLKEFQRNPSGRYATIASMTFQTGYLFLFMWRKNRFSMECGEYPAVVLEEGTMKFFETIWNGSTIEEFGTFVNSVSGYWLKLMEEYLAGEDAEEYAEEALMAFYRAGATCLFAWMQ